MKPRGCFFLLVVVFLLSGCVPVPSPTPTPYASLIAPYAFKNLYSSDYLSLHPTGSNLSNGDTVVQIAPSNYHLGLQNVWLVYPYGSGYLLVSAHSGKCLQTDSTQLKSPVHQQKCTGDAKQQWSFSGSAGASTIMSQYSQLCLAVPSTQEYEEVYQQDCSLALSDSTKSGLWAQEPKPNAPNPPHDSGSGQLCDACNPANPNCTGSGSMCAVLVSGQSLCATACSSAQPCPQGYDCKSVSAGAGVKNLCVPTDMSCPLDLP